MNATEKLPAEVATDRRVPRVLVVDDERSMRELLAIVLKREGYDVVLAENGRSAVAALGPIDFAMGLSKAAGFGVIIAAFGTRMGLRDKADAAALGQHTMSAVVIASFTVLIADHVFTTVILAMLG